MSRNNPKPPAIIISDSATKIGEDAAGSVVVAASHGGIYPAYLVASLDVRAAIFNDGGVGKNRAGIAGLNYLQDLGIPAAAVGNFSAKIGDGQDMFNRGIIEHINDLAHLAGCKIGMSCKEAAILLINSVINEKKTVPIYQESRQLLLSGPVEVWIIDSASLINPDDYKNILITGSHGGLLGNKLVTALKYDALAALFNDAGFGMENAGTSRLPILDQRGIAAGTVSVESACLGDGLSTYNDGIISAINNTARKYDVDVGMTAKEFVEKIKNRLIE